MAFPSPQTHRKLLFTNQSTSNPTTTVQTCLNFCDSPKNDIRFCPKECLAICPSTCHFSLSTPIYPPEVSPSQPNKPHNLSPLLISMLILLASTFLLITFYVLYTKLYFHLYGPHHNRNNSNPSVGRRRRRRRSGGSDFLDEEHGSPVVFHPIWYIPTVGLHPTVIRSISVYKYVKQRDQKERDCAVCLAEFEEGDELRVLPKCNHAFHVPCIDTWLTSHTSCPLCRAPITAPTNHDHHDVDHDPTAENSPPPPAAETEGNSPGEEGFESLEESIENKDQNREITQMGEIKGSCSQRWCLEKGAANLLNRSLSCSAKIFSSRSSNIRPSPNS